MESGSGKLVNEIERTLALLNERERTILKHRMGFGVNPERCREIGESYGCTRERIRQIESESLSKVVKAAFWIDLFVEN
jgi:DNA-directed RNA polymerase sigma subunit (sigma70/sigma32)